MAPTVSTPVLFIPSNIDSEVTGPSAAVVTNVHNENMINCQVFNDNDTSPMAWRTSVQHKSVLDPADVEEGNICYFILLDEQE